MRIKDFSKASLIKRTGCAAGGTLLFIALLTTGMLCGTVAAQTPPQVELACPDRSLAAQTPFELQVRISWPGDPEAFIIVPPEPSLPEGIELTSSAFDSTISAGLQQFTYRFVLVPRQTGQITLYPMEIKYWPKGSGEERTLLTTECSLTVVQFAFLQNKALLISALAAALLAIAVVMTLFIKKRAARSRVGAPADSGPDALLLVQRCRQLRMQGAYGAFYESALAAARLLMPDDQALHSRLTDAAERTAFGGMQPKAEEVERVLRQLERAADRQSPASREQDEYKKYCR